MLPSTTIIAMSTTTYINIYINNYRCHRRERRKVRPHVPVPLVLSWALVDLQRKRVNWRLEPHNAFVHICMTVQMHPLQSWYIMETGKRQKNGLDERRPGWVTPCSPYSQDDDLWDTWKTLPTLPCSVLQLCDDP